jgi:hypothetical protein
VLGTGSSLGFVLYAARTQLDTRVESAKWTRPSASTSNAASARISIETDPFVMVVSLTADRVSTTLDIVNGPASSYGVTEGAVRIHRRLRFGLLSFRPLRGFQCRDELRMVGHQSSLGVDSKLFDVNLDLSSREVDERLAHMPPPVREFYNRDKSSNIVFAKKLQPEPISSSMVDTSSLQINTTKMVCVSIRGREKHLVTS